MKVDTNPPTPLLTVWPAVMKISKCKLRMSSRNNNYNLELLKFKIWISLKPYLKKEKKICKISESNPWKNIYRQ